MFSLFSLDPDGCLLADSFALHSKLKEISGADKKRTNAVLNLFLQKIYPFCDGVVFFVDRSLLMGANALKFY
jgi:hypothetical protein